MIQQRHSLAMKQCLPPLHPCLPFFQDSCTCRIMPLYGEKKDRHPGLRSIRNLLAVRVSRSSDCWINGTIKAQGVFVLSAGKLRVDFSLTWSIPLHNVERKKNTEEECKRTLWCHVVCLNPIKCSISAQIASVKDIRPLHLRCDTASIFFNFQLFFQGLSPHFRAALRLQSPGRVFPKHAHAIVLT